MGSTYYKTYYVDSNGGADTNDGLSWATAYKKLSVALAASHASIAAAPTGWAARNRIFFKGDQTKTTEGEDLTALAQKTDIIGVGSTDWKAKPQLIGNHTIANTVSYMGCRFINVMFKGPTATGGDIFTITGQHGIAFIGCEFMGDSTTPATGAIISTGGVNLQVINCVSKGAFSDAVIEIGAGQADDLVIVGNLIQGANMGVEISASATFAAGKYGLIKDNVMSCTLACINDGEAKSYVIGNRLITAAAKGTGMEGCIVCNIALAQDNRCTTSDANNVEYPALGAI
ncbi:MAG: hypothetical protein PHG61_01925 [Candidatus Marinimicrobia bacterium]|nr:hypothetical protein [Candidatus Neomarinimicrobiota bacterium]